MQNDIEKIINKHNDEEFIILGTGPSINKFDFRCCNDKISLGCNGIGFLYIPDYYLIFDQFAYNKYGHLYEASKSKKILGSWINSDIYDYKLWYDLKDSFGFSKSKIFHSKSVGFIALNIAYIMGARKIYLIGIDGYNQKKIHFHEDSEDIIQKVNNDWTEEKKELFIKSFSYALKILNKEGIELINYSTDSILNEIIPTVKCYE